MARLSLVAEPVWSVRETVVEFGESFVAGDWAVVQSGDCGI